MWEDHSEGICETGRDCSGLWAANIMTKNFKHRHEGYSSY